MLDSKAAMARQYLRYQDKYDEALVAYETSIQLDPKFASPWYSKGLALRSLNRDLEAEEVFAKANVAGIGKLEAFN